MISMRKDSPVTEQKYPRWKVFLTLLFCPLFVGFAAIPVLLVRQLAALFSQPRLLGEVRGGEVLVGLMMTPLVVELVFLIPFLVFALWVSLRKTRLSSRQSWYRLAIAGGGLSTLWTLALAVAINASAKKPVIDYSWWIAVLFVVSTLAVGLLTKLVLPNTAELSTPPEQAGGSDA